MVNSKCKIGLATYGHLDISYPDRKRVSIPIVLAATQESCLLSLHYFAIFRRPGFQARRVKVQKRSSRMQAQGRASSTRVSCGGLHQEKFTAQAQKIETPARSSWKRMPFLGIRGKKPVGNTDISGNHGKIMVKSWGFQEF